MPSRLPTSDLLLSAWSYPMISTTSVLAPSRQRSCNRRLSLHRIGFSVKAKIQGTAMPYAIKRIGYHIEQSFCLGASNQTLSRRRMDIGAQNSTPFVS